MCIIYSDFFWQATLFLELVLSFNMYFTDASTIFRFFGPTTRDPFDKKSTLLDQHFSQVGHPIYTCQCLRVGGPRI